VRGAERKQRNEELHALYFSPELRERSNQGEKMNTARKRCIQNCNWKLETKRPLGRPSYRWNDNIKIEQESAENKIRKHVFDMYVFPQECKLHNSRRRIVLL
jgi:hypothetical protein